MALFIRNCNLILNALLVLLVGNGVEKMLTIQKITSRYGDCICRECINKRYDLNLTSKDCIFGYTYKCRVCQQPKRVVVGFTPSGKLKTLLK